MQPHDAVRQHQIAGKHGALIENAVPVSVAQPDYAMRSLHHQLVHRIIRAAGLGHIEVARFIARTTGNQKPLPRVGWPSRVSAGGREGDNPRGGIGRRRAG